MTKSRLVTAAGCSSAVPGNNASSPLPNALRIPFLHVSIYLPGILLQHGRGAPGRLANRRRELTREGTICDRAARARIIQKHRDSVTGTLRHPHVARNDGTEDLIAEVRADFLGYLPRKAVAAVEHRQHESFERERRIQQLAHPPDGVQESTQTL